MVIIGVNFYLCNNSMSTEKKLNEHSGLALLIYTYCPLQDTANSFA